MTARSASNGERPALTNGQGAPPPDEPRLRLTLAANVSATTVAWRWRGRLPEGKLTVLEGSPGLGKSTLALAIAAAVTTGAPLPGDDDASPADVVVASFEDGVADTLVPRILAAGGDPRRVHIVEGVQGRRETERPLTVPDDVPLLRAALVATGARLVILDPLAAVLSGAHDAHRDQDVRRALAPLARLADDLGVCILVVRHLRKGATGSAIDAGMGSIGIGAAARVVLAVHTHPDDPARRVLAVVKCNLAPEAPSLVWRLVTSVEHGCARVEWLGESDLRADAIMQAQREEVGLSASEGDRMEWLRNVLSAGPLPSREILDLARQAGYASRSLQRTAQHLRVVAVREGVGRAHRVLWALPASSGTPVAPVAGVI